MLNKVTYETEKHKIVIQKYGDDWLLQVFDGVGSTNIIEWEEYSDLEELKRYVSAQYL